MRREFRDIILDYTDLYQLKEMRDILDSFNSKSSKRIQFLIMEIENPNLKKIEISNELKINRRTLNRWTNTFKEGGLENLLDKDFSLVNGLSKKDLIFIDNWIESEHFKHCTLEDLVIDLEFAHNKEYSTEAISVIAKKVIANKCKILKISESELKRRIQVKKEAETRKRIKESAIYYANKIIEGKKIIY